MKIIFVILALALCTCTASADTIWTYTGNVASGASNQVLVPIINPCNCALSGSVTINALQDAVAWSFTDGTHTLTNFNSTGIVQPWNGIQERGTPTPFYSWKVLITDGSVTMLSMFYGSTFEATDSVVVGSNVFMMEQGNKGVWAAVPEPGTLALVGLGLVGVLLLKREGL